MTRITTTRRRLACSAFAVAAAAVGLAAPAASAADAARPATSPAAAASPQQEKVDKLFAYLETEYNKLLKSPDWMTRGLAVISMNRMPRDAVTPKLLQVMSTDRDPVVRMIAWQAVLSRADRLTPEQYKLWRDGTATIAPKGGFAGRLRLPMLDLLATAPISPPARTAFVAALDACDPNEPADVEVPNALGKCLLAWRQPDLVDFLISRLSTPTAGRAEVVLLAIGAPRGGDVATWWRGEKPQWKPMAKPADGEPWRALKPQFLAAPGWDDPVDAKDPRWYKDLELNKPNLKSFDFAFVVDATGSMGATIQWLRSDLTVAMRAVSYIAREPRIAVTFYRDEGDEFVAKTLPLTADLNALNQAVQQTDAGGGGDLPEAVFDGLNDSLMKNPWSAADKVPKVVVLIGDAPPKPGTVEKCEQLLAGATKKGLKLYAVKVGGGAREGALPEFDRMATAGNGVSLSVRDGQGMGEIVLTRVIADAIDPAYKDRVEPLVRVLLESQTVRTPAAAANGRPGVPVPPVRRPVR